MGRAPALGARTRPLVIVNPRSGGGRAGRTFDDVRAVIERRLGPVDVAFTRQPAHAIALAREAAENGTALLIAVGGDGTLHEVANGVLDAGVGDRTAVGYVGQGTGGDFRRTLGIEHRLDAYVESIASGRTLAVDAGKLRFLARDGAHATRWFVNILSAGMGGLVDRYVSETTKVLGGKPRISGQAPARSPRPGERASTATSRSKASAASATFPPS